MIKIRYKDNVPYLANIQNSAQIRAESLISEMNVVCPFPTQWAGPRRIWAESIFRSSELIPVDPG